MYKIFSGANGYYVAVEDEDGFHRQPSDNGSRIGWNAAAAKAELERLAEFAKEAAAFQRLEKMKAEYMRLLGEATAEMRAFLERVHPLQELKYEAEKEIWLRCAIRAAKEGRA